MTSSAAAPTDTYRLGDRDVRRMGYGAMQLAGPGVFGPPRDRDEAIAVLREAVASGVNHIDTSDYYGPFVTNELIREALHPYPVDLVIVSKVGAVRSDDAAWHPAQSPAELVAAVHDNLQRLGLDQLHAVNLRRMDDHGSNDPIEPQLGVLARLQQDGLVRHIGLSNVGAEMIDRARSVTAIACVQNEYNLVHRGDDALIDSLAADGIAYVPFFPLGGFSPLQSAALDDVATALDATPMQVALAWLLHRSPNILLIPGTSSRGHLRENIAASSLVLSNDALTRLDAIGTSARIAEPTN